MPPNNERIGDVVGDGLESKSDYSDGTGGRGSLAIDQETVMWVLEGIPLPRLEAALVNIRAARVAAVLCPTCDQTAGKCACNAPIDSPIRACLHPPPPLPRSSARAGGVSATIGIVTPSAYNVRSLSYAGYFAPSGLPPARGPHTAVGLARWDPRREPHLVGTQLTASLQISQALVPAYL